MKLLSEALQMLPSLSHSSAFTTEIGSYLSILIVNF